jgi:hypothetical protein
MGEPRNPRVGADRLGDHACDRGGGEGLGCLNADMEAALLAERVGWDTHMVEGHTCRRWDDFHCDNDKQETLSIARAIAAAVGGRAAA